jgi:hypothetical protein
MKPTSRFLFLQENFMKPRHLGLLLLSMLSVGVLGQVLIFAGESTPPNTLTAQEVKDGWKLLFDGKSLDGWRVYKKKDAGKWAAMDGLLVSGGGDLMTKAQFANFEFQTDWKFVKGNNSGIIYRVSEDGGESWNSGPEMQVMAHSPKDKPGKNGGGSLYDVFAPSSNAVKPISEWNTFKVVVNGKHIEHWVNGVKVVDCDIGSDDWNKAIEKSKWKGSKLFASKAAGHIALQDHGGMVTFRNIKIRVLPDSADKK